MLEFGGLITAGAFVRAQQLHLRSMMWIGDVFTYVVLTGVFTYSLRSLWFAAIYAVPITAIFGFLSRVWQRSRWTKLYRQSPHLHDPIHGALHADRLVSSNSIGTNEVPWSKFVNRRVGKDLMLLYLAPNLFVPLAREQFPSESEWLQAKTIVQEKIVG